MSMNIRLSKRETDLLREVLTNSSIQLPDTFSIDISSVDPIVEAIVDRIVTHGLDEQGEVSRYGAELDDLLGKINMARIAYLASDPQDGASGV